MAARRPVPPDLLETVTRVGVKDEDRFRWLVEVAEKDVKRASPAELDALRWQMLAFALSGRRDLAPEPTGGPLFGPGYAPIVCRLHKQLKAGLQELRTHQQLTLPKPVIDRAVWRPTVPDIVPVNTRDVEQRFWAAVVALLMKVGPRLRICARPVCARFLLTTRPGQRYCSSACSQRVRTARFRKAHPDKVRKWKHAVYVERRRKQTGDPTLKVARRPRASAR